MMQLSHVNLEYSTWMANGHQSGPEIKSKLAAENVAILRDSSQVTTGESNPVFTHMVYGVYLSANSFLSLY